MRMMYLLPQTNMTINDPVGNAIRIREIIRGFEKIGGTAVIDSAGESQEDVAAMNAYRSGIRDKIPPRLAGTLRDGFFIYQDYRARERIYSRARAAMPLDFIMEEYTHFRRAGVALSKEIKVPIFLDDIIPFWEAEQYHYRRELKRIALMIQRRVFKEAFGLIAVSGTIRDYIISEGGHPDHVHIIPNGADVERFRPGIGGDKIRQQYNIPADRVVVGFLGSFLPWRGLPMLIEAARALVPSNPNLHFMLVGDGDNRAELEAQVQAARIADHVTFTGSVKFDSVPPYVDAMDITVLPDSNEYTNPIKLFEYMALAKPSIAPSFSPIREIITDGVDGKLFAPKDQDALNAAILDLLADDDRRKEMSVQARQTVVERFTWEKHAQKIYDISKSYVRA